MLARVRSRKERHRERGKLYRISFGVVGGLLIVVGLLLTLPGVPGPGLVIVAVGLGMLALEFDRAERLLERVLRRLDRISEQASSMPAWLTAALAVAAVGGAALAVYLWDVPLVPF